MSREILFGIPGFMKSIPCPLSGMEISSTGSQTTTKLLNGRNFVGGSIATAKENEVSWLGTPDELQDIIDYGSGVYGNGPFLYTDPMSFDNALSSVYAAPHLLEDIEHLKVTGVRVKRVAQAATTHGTPPFAAEVTREAVPNYTVPSNMTVAIPPGHKAHVRVYAAQADAVRVATGTAAGAFSLASTQPTGGTGLYSATYTGVGFVSLHFAAVGTRTVRGLVVQVLPDAADASETLWHGGLGHSWVRFGDNGLNQSAYMAKTANGRGLIGLSGTLVEV